MGSRYCDDDTLAVGGTSTGNSTSLSATVRFVFNPVVVLRTGGLAIASAQFPAGAAVTREAAALADRAIVASRCMALCLELESVLPAAYQLETACGRSVLAAKRALFNGKSPTDEQIARIAPVLNAQQKDELQELAGALRGDDPDHVRRRAYHDELMAGYDAALVVARQPLLRRGIEVANSELFKRLERFEQHPESFAGKDRNQLAIRLARYALRASRKTSPLSSLGLVSLCHVDDTARWNPAEQPLACPADVQHATHVSHSALEALLVPLIADLERLDAETRICLNSSLEAGQGGFSWWRVLKDEQPDSRIRRSRLQAASSNGTLLHVLARLAGGNPAKEYSIRGLMETLETLLPVASAARLGPLLEELWRLDFIQPDLAQVGDQLALARARVAALEPALAGAMGQSMDTLSDLLAEPDDHSPASVMQIEAVFGKLLQLAGSKAPLQKFRPIVVENCTSGEPVPRIGPALLEDVRPVLSLLLRLAPLLAADSPMARLRSFAVDTFLETYGSGQAVADCLPFIRSCSARILGFLAASPNDRQDTLTVTRDADPRRARLRNLREALLDLIAEASASGRATTFRAADFEGFATQSTELAHTNIVSHMFFMQPFVDKGTTSYVLNQIYPGATSTYTRFLEKRADLWSPTADYLQRVSEPGPCWELAESFCFNASAYPPLTGRRVSVPPHHVNSDDVISIDNFGMRHRPEFNDLVFTDRNGDDVSIFYPVVMSPFAMAMPQQIVRALGSWVEMIDELWQVAASRVPADSEGIRRLSRVSIDNVVVIRECLVCPRNVLPSAALPEADFFFDLARWARAHALPRHIFVRRFMPEDNADSEMWGKPPGKSGKPMPVDLYCPISVLAFQKKLAQASDHIVFSEALPGPEQYVAVRGGEPVVSELGIEMSMFIGREVTPCDV